MERCDDRKERTREKKLLHEKSIVDREEDNKTCEELIDDIVAVKRPRSGINQ